MIKNFLKPKTAQEAVLMKKEHKDALYIAGGTWINSSYSKLNPETVISLTDLELSSITKKQDTLFIGSGVNVQKLIDSNGVPYVLREAARHIGSRNIRNAATIGGSIGAGSLWFSLTPSLLVLDASLIVHNGEKEQEIRLADYLERDSKDLVLTIKVPLNPRRFANVLKYSRTARTVPVIVAAVSFAKDNKDISNPLIAIGGVADKVVFFKDINVVSPREELEEIITARVNPKGDFRASSKLRKYMAGVLVADCFEGASI